MLPAYQWDSADAEFVSTQETLRNIRFGRKRADQEVSDKEFEDLLVDLLSK